MKARLSCTISMANSKDPTLFDCNFGPIEIAQNQPEAPLLYAWLFTQIYALDQKLKIRTANTGRLTELTNADDILKKWHVTRGEILSHLDKEKGESTVKYFDAEYAHLNTVCQTNILMNFLFNDLFQVYDDKPVASSKELSKVYGTSMLPVAEYKSLAAVDEARQTATISVSGKIESSKLDKVAISKYMTELNQYHDEDPEYRLNDSGTYVVSTGDPGSRFLEASLMLDASFGEDYQFILSYALKLHTDE